MSDYRKAVDKVIKNEGGYVNNPLDNGGETYKGISRKFFGKSEIWAIIDEYDHFDDRLDGLVIKFYKEQFWDRLRLSEVHDEFVAGMLLDFGVNIGKKVVTKKIQRIVKVNQDGIIGPITLKAVNSMDRDAFVFQFILEVTELYVQIVNRNRSQKVFLLGWCNRAMSSYYEYLHYKN